MKNKLEDCSSEKTTASSAHTTNIQLKKQQESSLPFFITNIRDTKTVLCHLEISAQGLLPAVRLTSSSDCVIRDKNVAFMMELSYHASSLSIGLDWCSNMVLNLEAISKR